MGRPWIKCVGSGQFGDCGSRGAIGGPACCDLSAQRAGGNRGIFSRIQNRGKAEFIFQCPLTRGQEALLCLSTHRCHSVVPYWPSYSI